MSWEQQLNITNKKRWKARKNYEEKIFSTITGAKETIGGTVSPLSYIRKGVQSFRICERLCICITKRL